MEHNVWSPIEVFEYILLVPIYIVGQKDGNKDQINDTSSWDPLYSLIV